MVKLTPVVVDDRAIYHELLTTQDPAVDDPALEASLDRRFVEYDASFPVLSRLMSCPADLLARKEQLLDLYNRRRGSATLLYRSIRALETRFCPFCGRPGDPGTLDHFLDKDEFPEFSLYSKNLVPACDICQRSKGTKVWDAGGRRLFLNPYLDEFLTTPFYRVVVRAPYEVPLFRLVLDVHDPEAAAICESHFELLHVEEKVRASCLLHYKALRHEIEPEVSAKELTFASLKLRLERRAAGCAAAWGANSWTAALHRGLAADDQVLRFLTETPLPLPPLPLPLPRRV